MIEAIGVSKEFERIKAVDNISLTIKEGNVFGLIGTNGAGKSTLIRMLCGILKPSSGTIKIDGISVFEQVNAKELFFYISDDQYFFNNSTPNDLRKFYSTVYPKFDSERFHTLIKQFDLDEKRKLNTFSKGMKKQVSIICGICSNSKYLFCDETFDGLDPVMRQAVKSIFVKEMSERNMTPIIASHNLRELEDICDHIGLLHKGGVLLSKELFDMKLNIHKVQVVFREGTDTENIFVKEDIIKEENRGSLRTLTIRGNDNEIIQRLERAKPVFYEILPLSLEEIFISETEVVGYDIKKLIF